MRSTPVLVAGLLLGLASVSRLAAHPNHQATQRTTVTLVPATAQPPAASEVSITTEGDRRIITANGLPDHATGPFPNRDNPHAVRAQSYRYTMPLRPTVNATATPLPRQPFGIALNGVLFDPGTAEYWQNDRDSGWRYDALGSAFSLGLDTNHAHVQPNGAYHYHGLPTALLARLAADRPGLVLVGWAADGFPIYAVSPASAAAQQLRTSYQLKPGNRPTTDGQPGGRYDGSFVEDFAYVAGSGDLDECSGRFGATPEFPTGTYHYVLTADFPFVPRAFRGTPDPSFARRGGPDAPRPPR
jgi:YHYH protein